MTLATSLDEKENILLIFNYNNLFDKNLGFKYMICFWTSLKDFEYRNSYKWPPSQSGALLSERKKYSKTICRSSNGSLHKKGYIYCPRPPQRNLKQTFLLSDNINLLNRLNCRQVISFTAQDELIDFICPFKLSI